MKLLSWNIQHGGGTRITRICDAIVAHDADLVILSEFRTGPGARIQAALTSAGWPFSASTNPIGSDNGIAVFARTPFTAVTPAVAPPENAVRWLDIDLPAWGFGVGALHIITSVPKQPGPPGVAKTRFWEAVIAQAQERTQSPFVFVGDLNTGQHRIDERGRTFVCAQHFGRMTECGWTDAWRHFNGSELEATWISHGRNATVGNPFRLDHAFVSPALMPRVTSCKYSHAEREAKVSDHSILLMEIASPTFGRKEHSCP